jgi:hypothetical protein
MRWTSLYSELHRVAPARYVLDFFALIHLMDQLRRVIDQTHRGFAPLRDGGDSRTLPRASGDDPTVPAGRYCPACVTGGRSYGPSDTYV